MEKRKIFYEVTFNFKKDEAKQSEFNDHIDEIAVQLFDISKNRRYLIGDYSIFGDNIIRKNPLQYINAGTYPATDEEFLQSGLEMFKGLDMEEFNAGNEISIPVSFLRAISYYAKAKKNNIIEDPRVMPFESEDFGPTDEELMQRKRDKWY